MLKKIKKKMQKSLLVLVGGDTTTNAGSSNSELHLMSYFFKKCYHIQAGACPSDQSHVIP